MRVTLRETWRVIESLVDRRKCRAIGLSGIGLNELLPISETARITADRWSKSNRIRICRKRSLWNSATLRTSAFLAFAPLGHELSPNCSKIQ